MNTRRIILEGLRLQAFIGMLDHERLARQSLVIRGEFDADASRPVDDHDIGSVLDYRALRNALIEESTQCHTDLLETLVERCLARILDEFPAIHHATIRICKPEAFDDCDAVCIEQSRSRA
jgi:dihydroneopterin aldolase